MCLIRAEYQQMMEFSCKIKAGSFVHHLNNTYDENFVSWLNI
ncbi:hypothetical protein B4107_3146 [Bacillus safensis]|nr:hypothetical protein B4107_3146 [Bacillus safensis]